LREAADCGISVETLEDATMTEIRNTTRNLAEAMWADEWPRRGAVVDFGVPYGLLGSPN
jgi:hypothetical protein